MRMSKIVCWLESRCRVTCRQYCRPRFSETGGGSLGRRTLSFLVSIGLGGEACTLPRKLNSVRGGQANSRRPCGHI